MHRGLCYVESKFKKHLFLPLKSSLAAKIPLGFFTFLPFYL